MNLAGFLITLANMQNFAGPDSHLKDMTIKVEEVEALANEIKILPGFNLDDFRCDGFIRSGKVAKYLSKNLKEYLFKLNDEIRPKDEGIVITLYFSDEASKPEDDEELKRKLSGLVEYNDDGIEV